MKFYIKEGFVEEKKKILILENEIDLAEMLKLRLEENNYKVVLAHDGQEGFKEKFAIKKPDYIF